jgi:hypothetical protein
MQRCPATSAQACATLGPELPLLLPHPAVEANQRPHTNSAPIPPAAAPLVPPIAELFRERFIGS